MLIVPAELLAGLRSGVVALACLLMVTAWRRSRGPHRPLAAAGLVLVGATVAGLAGAGEYPRGLLPALAVLAVGGAVAARVRVPQLSPPRGARSVVRVALAGPGAVMIATRSDVAHQRWIGLLAAVAIVFGSILVADVDDRWRRRAPAPLLFAITCLGAYVTLPETEQVLVLLGAALPVAVLGWPLKAASLGSAGAFAGVGLFTWTAAVGGLARPTAIIGALASLGMLLAEPVGRWLALGPGDPTGRLGRGSGAVLEELPRPWVVPAFAAVQVALALVTSRVASLQSSLPKACLIAGGSLVVGVCVASAAHRWAAAIARRPSPASG